MKQTFNKNSISLFKNYLNSSKNNEQNLSDPIDNHYSNKKEMRKIIKEFWKNKNSPFYKEAYKLYLINTFVFLFWFVVSTIGISLITNQPQNFSFLVSGIILLSLAYISNIAYVIYSIYNKPSYYDVVLIDTKIKTNYKTMLFFYFFGFTSLIGKAIFDAIQSEMILLISIKEDQKK